MLRLKDRSQHHRLVAAPEADDAYIVDPKGFIKRAKKKTKRPYNNIFDYIIIEDHLLIESFMTHAKKLKPEVLSVRCRIDDQTMIWVKVRAVRMDAAETLMKIFYGQKAHLRKRFQRSS